MENGKIFISEEGKSKVLNYYNQVLSVLPFSQHYIDTPYGKTFLLEAGKENNPPIILLHGSCSNSAFWFGEITALSQAYHVVAVDILGEAGNSEGKRYDLASGAYARWLNALLDALALKSAVVVGNSLGGWMSLDFATAYPNRVKALVLLAASGLAPNRYAFINQTKDAFARGDEQRQNLQDDILGDAAIPKEVGDFLRLIGENFIPVTGALPVFGDARLQRLNMPVLALWGRKDIAVDTKKSAQRIAKFVPHAKVCLLDCGHVILGAENMILDFLKNNK